MESGYPGSPPDSVTELAEADSWSFLRSQEIGRLAVLADGVPDIFPVNFIAHEHTILFRTAQGTKLWAIAANSTVAFEADHWNAAEGTSVVIRGRARTLAAAEAGDAARFGLRSWLRDPKPVFVRIQPDMITGRRLRLGR